MGKKTKFTEEELKVMEEMDALSAQAQADPQIRNVSVPDSLWHELKRDIREYEAEKRAKEQEQRNQELIKLGLVYERRRKYRKYYVLAATLILVLSLGITSFGGAEKLFNMIKGYANGREQTNVNSQENIEIVTELDEELIYTNIEKDFGFHPVKLDYLPKEIGFIEASSYNEVQGIQLIYGKNDTVNVLYLIRPNFRDGSLGRDIEDELIEEYEKIIDNVVLYIRKYKVENETVRWSVQFVHRDISYSLLIMGVEDSEFQKITENLYFF